MKLNNKIVVKGTVLCSALLATGICFSSPVDKELISKRCEAVYNKLYGLFEEHASAPCAVKVRYSSYVMLGASMLVHSERYSEAMNNLDIAEGNLANIYLKSQECAYFSPKVKPSLDEVRVLMNELKYGTN